MNKPTYTIKPLYLGEMTRYEKSMHTFTFDYGVKMHSPYLAFLVQGDGKNILVDTGPKNLEVIKRQTCPQRFTCSRSWKSTD